jgi:hypothetical protein
MVRRGLEPGVGAATVGGEGDGDDGESIDEAWGGVGAAASLGGELAPAVTAVPRC